MTQPRNEQNKKIGSGLEIQLIFPGKYHEFGEKLLTGFNSTYYHTFVYHSHIYGIFISSTIALIHNSSNDFIRSFSDGASIKINKSKTISKCIQKTWKKSSVWC